MNKVSLGCKCYHTAHSIEFVFDRTTPEEDPEIYVTTVMSSYLYSSFWDRLKDAFNYLFKRKEIVLAETILDADAVDSLGKLVVTYRLLKKVRASKRSSSTEE